MKPADPLKDMTRLRDDWRRQVTRLQGQANRSKPDERRLLEMHARVLGACEQDIDDLIKGKGHPSGRRS